MTELIEPAPAPVSEQITGRVKTFFNPERRNQLRTNPPLFMTVQEAAIVSTLSVRTIRSAISARRLRVCRATGRRNVIRLEDLEKFLSA